MRTEFLPFSIPSFDDAEIAQVTEAIRSGWVTTGPKTKQFEEACRKYIGCGYAVAVSSCTAGLHLGLNALGIGPGDEVIVPTMTFCSTANVVVHTGATPILVDSGPDMNVDPDRVREAITQRTKAIIPVHYAGQPCDMDVLKKIADDSGLFVVEDAAHAIGTEIMGKKLGSASDLAVFSFYATKNLSTGEGGLVVTKDEGLASRIRLMSLHGMDRDAWKRYTASGSWFYEVTDPGFKYNFTDLQAALGLPQLSKLDSFIERRSEIAAIYNKAFVGLRNVRVPVVRHGIRHAWHLYVLWIDTIALGMGRDVFIDELRARNIGSSVHFIPVHMHPYYAARPETHPHPLTVAEEIFKGIVSLPLYPKMTDDDVLDVILSVTEIVGEGLK